jgi:short-subunit dehydrogenase
MELRGTTGILTGASRGIGLYLATALARKGVNLALAARSEEDLLLTEKKLEGFGIKTITVPTDVNDRSALQNLVSRTEDELGPVDLLVNNAGIEKYEHFEAYDPDLIEAIYRTNLLAPAWLMRLVLPGMVKRRKGHIVNIASVAGKTAVPFNAIYSSSKHGLVGLSWSTREEMKPHGVGVSVICPGFVAEAGMYADWSRGSDPPKISKAVAPELVAAKTIEAIEKDKAEVIVAKGLVKVVDVFHAMSPAFTTALARRMGSYRYFEEEAIKKQGAK